MTVQHYLISRFGLGVCAAWAKLYKVIARDITIYGTFAFFTQQQFEANKRCEIKFGWITVFFRLQMQTSKYSLGKRPFH